METKKKKLGIEETLSRLFKKASKSDVIDEEYEDEDDYTSEDDLDPEIEEEADDYVDADTDAVDEEAKDEELEKAEEDEIADESEVPEEEIEDDEDVEELDYDELLEKIRSDLNVDELAAQVEDLVANVTRVVDLLEINTDNTIENAENTEKLEKSIAALTKKLSKTTRIRKSVKNAKINNKFEEEKKTVNDLSKSERAEILSNEFLAGNRNVTSFDVTKAEQGAPLSDECIAVIEKHLI